MTPSTGNLQRISFIRERTLFMQPPLLFLLSSLISLCLLMTSESA